AAPATEVVASPSVAEENIKLTQSIGKSAPAHDINYRITSQVISDIRRMLKDGELEAAYQTLNNWPAHERGDIYDTAARHFLAAGMNSEAADMWQRNMGFDGDLQGKALRGITQSLTAGDDLDKLLEWLPLFLQRARNQLNEPHQTLQIGAKDFEKIFQSLAKRNDLSDEEKISGAKADQLLDFYETYVSLYPDSNSPELLYYMGLFFERPGKSQDLRRAKQLYQNLRANYPVDEYSPKASKRLHYLNRQFFLVQ
ncbi:MAG: hypothetical protein AAF975_03150, partial [Spirochaetota bacterium]